MANYSSEWNGSNSVARFGDGNELDDHIIAEEIIRTCIALEVHDVDDWWRDNITTNDDNTAILVQLINDVHQLTISSTEKDIAEVAELMEQYQDRDSNQLVDGDIEQMLKNLIETLDEIEG